MVIDPYVIFRSISWFYILFDFEQEQIKSDLLTQVAKLEKKGGGEEGKERKKTQRKQLSPSLGGKTYIENVARL
jgi:hypothetical protein